VLVQSSRSFVYSPYIYAMETVPGKWKAKDDEILNYFPFSTKHPLWYHMIVDGLFITIPGMLFKKSLLEKVGRWREDVTASEDWDYLFRLGLEESHPAHTNECAFIYRLHGGQTTDNHFTNYHRDQEKKIVLEDLYTKYIQTNRHFSSLQKMIFLNKLYQIFTVVPQGEDLKVQLSRYDTWVHRLLWSGIRMRLKYGRMKTGTNWQRSYGPLVSKEKSEYYLGKL
jgi:hypothetical protein